DASPRPIVIPGRSVIRARPRVLAPRRTRTRARASHAGSRTTLLVTRQRLLVQPERENGRRAHGAVPDAWPAGHPAASRAVPAASGRRLAPHRARPLPGSPSGDAHDLAPHGVP